MLPRAARSVALLALFTGGCFVISQARTKRQAELGEDYAAAYGLTLRLSKALDRDPSKVTPESLTEAIQAADSCQQTVIGKLDESINDMGAMLYEDPTTEGFTYGGLLVPIATAYGHCRRIHGDLLSREVRACPSMEGAFLENFSFGRSVGKEFRGMGTWSAETCVLEAGDVVDPAGKLTAEEVAKARRVCTGAVAFRVFEQGNLVKHDATTHYRRTPVRCEKAPVVFKGSAVPRARPLPPIDEKCPKCAAWSQAGAADQLKPSLKDTMRLTGSSPESEP
jgi:hypothetical protein